MEAQWANQNQNKDLSLMKKTITFAIAGTALLIAGTGVISHAQQDPDDRPMDRGERRAMMKEAAMERFADFDMNADGEITQAEVEAKRAADFAAADTDASGGLSPDEAAAWQAVQRAEREARRAASRFERADENSDGVIGLDEFGDRQVTMFERIDENGDGTITEAEIEAGMKKMARRARHHRGGEGRGR